MSQPQFAAAFGFELATLRQWEQGRRPVPRLVLILLRVIAAQPELVKAAAKRVPL